MIRLLVILAVFAVALFGAYLLVSVIDYMQVKMTNAVNSIAATMRYGHVVNVPPGHGIRISNGTVSVSVGAAGGISIADSTCIVAANETWQWHGCGPTTVAISPGNYSISVVRYPPLRQDFAGAIASISPFAVLAVLVLVVLLLYTRWR
jgi:hypothetical protein